MELNNKPVSERMKVQGVFLGINEGEYRGYEFKKLQFVNVDGVHSVDYTEDITALEPGEVYDFYVRMYHPERQISKFERKFICDGAKPAEIPF